MDILHPHMLSRQQLLEIFRQRNFTIPRLEECSRDELISLYTKHLLPLPRRGGGGGSSTSQDIEMKESSKQRHNNPNVRQRIVYSDHSPVDNVSHGVKRIKLINTGERTGTTTTSCSGSTASVGNGSKRSLEVSPSKMSGSRSDYTARTTVNPTPTKRQKITWP